MWISSLFAEISKTLTRDSPHDFFLARATGTSHPVQFENCVELHIFADPEFLIYNRVGNSSL